MRYFLAAVAGLVLAVLVPLAVHADCIKCHSKITPRIVTDWKLSKHAVNDVGCDACHGGEHQKGKTDSKMARLATPETCAECHEEKVAQFKRGKHAIAWASVNAMPTTHWQPSELLEGLKGCTGCHKIGLKNEEQIRELVDAGSGGSGVASCDNCHTRHLFSKEEASAPQACRTCHMGMDHPQWEMYESSKHGVRYLLKQAGVLPPESAAPTCQTCHIPGGDHEVRTAWGFLAVRLPLPEDKQWAADQVTVLKALGVLDPEGNPTPRLEVVKQADVARLTQEAFDKERNRMIAVCTQCHTKKFAKAEMEKGDRMVQSADRLLAQAIEEVAGLYRDGILKNPESYAYAYPDLLTFHDSPTTVENRLFLMHLKHRMRTFQGAFHANPDYTFWYGWSEMVRDLREIQEKSAEMRAKAK